MPELTAATASDFIDCTIADKAVPKPTAQLNLTKTEMGVSQIWGYFFGAPYNKSYSILGSIFGSPGPDLGKLPNLFRRYGTGVGSFISNLVDGTSGKLSIGVDTLQNAWLTPCNYMNLQTLWRSKFNGKTTKIRIHQSTYVPRLLH